MNRELGVVPRVSFNFRPFQQALNIGSKKYALSELPRPTGQTDISVDIDLIGTDYVISVISSDAVNNAETVRLFTKALKATLLPLMRQWRICIPC